MRRHSAKQLNFRAVPVIGVGLLLFLEAAAHSLALFAAVAFGLIAICIWYVGARARLRVMHRWASVSNMYSLSPDAFEQHVASTFQLLGFKATVTPRVGDQGIDVIAERNGERIGIQCKRSNDRTPNSAVQEAYAGQAHYGCTKSMVVALGGFTSSAQALAASTAVELVDGARYADVFHRASATLPTRSVWTVFPPKNAAIMAISCASASLISFLIALS